MAERAGFEPAVPIAGYTRFPSVLLRPLGHLSVSLGTHPLLVSSPIKVEEMVRKLGFMAGRGLYQSPPSFPLFFANVLLQLYCSTALLLYKIMPGSPHACMGGEWHSFVGGMGEGFPQPCSWTWRGIVAGSDKRIGRLRPAKSVGFRLRDIIPDAPLAACLGMEERSQERSSCDGEAPRLAWGYFTASSPLSPF